MKRGAECHADHQLLCVKVKMARKVYHRKAPPTRTRRFDVSKLVRSGSENDSRPTQRSLFQEQVNDRAATEWPVGGSAQEKWEALKSALCKSAEALLGIEDRRHPDWFCESAGRLKPVLQRRNELYTKWLATKCTNDLSQFRRARSECRWAIREAKNQWFQSKAEEAQKARFGGKTVWRCIRDMQRCRRGLVPSKSATINDEEGNPCTTPLAQQQRWKRQCPVCRRCFRREGDRARHKCTADRQKPVWEQHGAVQCPSCSCWFRSVGGLTVHRCGPQQPSSTGPTTRSSTRQPSRPPGPVQCQVCERWFRRPSD